MNTVSQTCACGRLPQHEPNTAIQRWASAVSRFWASWGASRRTRLTERQLTALDGLSAEMLEDIGAPEWLQAQVHRRQERARQGGLFERESLYWR